MDGWQEVRARLVVPEPVLHERQVPPHPTLAHGSQLRTGQLHSPPGPWEPLERLELRERKRAEKRWCVCARPPKARARVRVDVDIARDLRGERSLGVVRLRGQSGVDR